MPTSSMRQPMMSMLAVVVAVAAVGNIAVAVAADADDGVDDAAVVQFVGMNYLNAHDVEISIVIVVCAVVVGGVAVFVPAADNSCRRQHRCEMVSQDVGERSPNWVAAANHCDTADFADDDYNAAVAVDNAADACNHSYYVDAVRKEPADIAVAAVGHA